MPPYRIIAFVKTAHLDEWGIPLPHLLGMVLVRDTIRHTPKTGVIKKTDVLTLYFSVGTLEVTGNDLRGLYVRLALGTPDSKDSSFITIRETPSKMMIGELS